MDKLADRRVAVIGTRATAVQCVPHLARHALDRGFREVEASPQAEGAWMELLQSGPGSIIGSPDCTPGYYNNEGQDPGPQRSWLGAGYPEGASAYFEYIERWRTSGTFDGLEFR
jgi:hypothetical protein